MLDELDQLINKFIDTFVLPLPLFVFHLPYVAAKGVQGVGLTTRARFSRRQADLIQQCQAEIDPEPPAEPDPTKDRSPG